MDSSEPAQISLSTKHDSFEGITQQVRWLCILIVGCTFWALPAHRLWFAGLLGAAIVYNLLRMTPLSRIPLVRSFVTIIAMDLVFAALAISFSGGADSPYLGLFALMAMSAAFWYGIKGLATVVIIESAFIAGMLVYTNFDLKNWPWIFVRAALIIAIGYYVLRLTQNDRLERTELRQLNVAVQRERQRLEALVNSLGDGVIAVDSGGMISLANQAAANLFGQTELIGRPFDNTVALHNAQKQPIRLFEGSSLEKEVSRSDLYLSLRGEEIALELRITPLKVGTQSQGSIIFIRDITKQKSLEQERDEFISLASHELRTPLAVAEGNLSLAMSPVTSSSPEKTAELLQKTYRNVRHLSELVADLTTLDQADKGLLDVELERVDVAEIIKGLANDFQRQVSEKNLELKIEIDPNARPVVTSKFRLVEVLTNFVSNAIKYTQKGTITLKVAADARSNGVVTSVTDTGMGISASDRQKIFDKFYRSEDYQTRATEGSGLGLYIVKKLAARLNGEVWLDSEVNRGSTFYLRVPQYSMLREDQPKVVAADVDSFITGV